MPRGGRRPGAGRKKGSLDRTTPEVKAARADFCTSLVEDPKYQARLRKRILAGKCAPAVETMVWHYARGKPPDNVRLGDPEGKPLKSIQVIAPHA